MANYLDTSTLGDEQSAKKHGSTLGTAPNARRELRADPCGEDLDWSRGLEGLRRSVGRPSGLTGPLLTKVIEREIIPRLFLTHCDLDLGGKVVRTESDPFANLDSEALTRLVLGNEPADRIIDLMQGLLDRGVSLQRIYLDLLAPIARRLGEFWEQDRCTFIDMTIALSRLHLVLREVGRRSGESRRRRTGPRRAFLVPAPGEQHTFGLLMIEEFFLHAGWQVASNNSASPSVIKETLASQPVDVVGFSIGCEEYFGPLQDLIKQLPAASINKELAIMVGGRLFKDCPDYSDKLVGATVIADGVHAVEAAESLLSPPSRLESIEQPT